MVGGVYTHLDDMLASQYQSIDWTQHTTCQTSISWGNLLAPGTVHKKKLHTRPALIWTAVSTTI